MTEPTAPRVDKIAAELVCGHILHFQPNDANALYKAVREHIGVCVVAARLLRTQRRTRDAVKRRAIDPYPLTPARCEPEANS
jgi:hypothetical protein